MTEINKEKKYSRRQLQALQTRENLLASGRIEFLDKGFKKTTMTQVNKTANTGYGTAYVYFKNKDALFIELMESTIQKMYDVAEMQFAPETKEQAAKQIETQAKLFMESALAERRMMIVIYEAIGVSEEVYERWVAIREHFISKITNDIRLVQQNGLANRGLSATLIARGWFYLNEHTMWDLVLGTIDDDIDIIVRHVTHLYMNGLYE